MHRFHAFRDFDPFRDFGSRGSRRWGPFEFRWDIDAEDIVSMKGGGRRRRFDGSELKLILLALIADAPRHGYDLIREIEERTGGAYAPSPGVVYPTLTLLADMDHIAEQAADGAKKLYAITPAGEAHLEDNAAQVAELMGRLAEMGTMREKSRGGPEQRAMMNLKLAIRSRFDRWKSGDGPAPSEAEIRHLIADILDEAARRIERL